MNKRMFSSFSLSAIIFAFVFSLSHQAQAARGGGGGGFGGSSAFEFALGLNSSSQATVNDMISSANTRVGGISTPSMSSAYEFSASYNMRFSGTMYGLVFRPSYIMQSSKGSGSGGDYNYELSGFTFFPIFRMTPLENSFIKFFLQTGIGYGKLSTTIKEGANTISFSGDNFGALVGLGVDFCFTPSHCLTIEGNARYLPIQRNIIDSVSGSFPFLSKTPVNGGEAEASNNDFATTMSGIQGLIAYTLNF